MLKPYLAVVALLVATVAAHAHDTWVQTNTNIVRAGDVAHIDLMLGNHGNEHRDYKLAGKVELESSTLAVVAPDGKRYDLKSEAVDTGYTPKEGYWSAPFTAAAPGLYMVAHTFDKVMSYAPVRDIKCAKTFFLVSKSLDNPGMNQRGFDRRIGAPLELVVEKNPVTPMGPGETISVRLYYKGKPLPDARVSCVPRGATLTESFDTRYEQKTNSNGRAKFTPKEGNYYLIAAHVKEPGEKGTGYEAVNYSATLTVFVPQLCACCGG